MTHLAVAIAAADTSAAIAALQQAATRAELAELRLDLMDSFDLPALLGHPPLPLIVTCRPPREGGRWQGTEQERLAVLRAASTFGPACIDLEWDAAGAAASFDLSRSRLILSHHDFQGMPADLPGLAAQMRSAGADIVKLVGAARGLRDSLPVLRLLAQAGGPIIAIAMGESGLLTRLLAFRTPNAFLSFAAPDHISGTAPGQITLSAMHSLYHVQTLGPHTQVIGLLAPDANESPLLLEGNVWLAGRNLDARLLPLALGPEEPPQAAVEALRTVLPLTGCLLEPPFDRHICPGRQAQRDAGLRNVVSLANGNCTSTQLSGVGDRLAWLIK